MTPLDLLLAAALTFRLTRLVTDDVIFDGPRNWLAERLPGSAPAYLLGCSWCASIWVAAGVVTLWSYAPEWLWQGAGMAAAASAVTGLVATKWDE